MTGAHVIALVAARDEADRVADTVRALRGIPAVAEVVVADNGSRDGTAQAASTAGARVLASSRRRGKGAAMERALRRRAAEGGGPDVWLLADADLGGSAAGLAAVLDEVLGDRADLAIAVFPPLGGGGFGVVRWFAALGIRVVAGTRVREPLSGQRAVTAACLDACRPLARGFGVETAMTIDAARAAFRIGEVPVPGLTHRPTGRGARGFAHRARQGIDVAIALARRSVGRR